MFTFVYFTPPPSLQSTIPPIRPTWSFFNVKQQCFARITETGTDNDNGGGNNDYDDDNGNFDEKLQQKTNNNYHDF